MREVVNKINDFLKVNQWCDFEIVELKGTLIIGGKISFDDNYDILISFKDVFFFQCLYNWKTDTTYESFVIPSIEEQRTININYGIEQGFQLYKIIAEDIKSPMYISSRSIEVNFPKNN